MLVLFYISANNTLTITFICHYCCLCLSIQCSSLVVFQLEQGLSLIAFNVATAPEQIFGFFLIFWTVKVYHFLRSIYINHKYGVIVYGVVCLRFFGFVSHFFDGNVVLFWHCCL